MRLSCCIHTIVLFETGMNESFACWNLNIVWHNDVFDQKKTLKFEFLRLLRQLICHMIRGKLLHSYVGDEHPFTILYGCV